MIVMSEKNSMIPIYYDYVGVILILIFILILLMAEILHYLGSSNPVNNGRSNQPQLVTSGFLNHQQYDFRDYNTQLYRDYFISHYIYIYIWIPINQSVFHGISRTGFEVLVSVAHFAHH